MKNAPHKLTRGERKEILDDTYADYLKTYDYEIDSRQPLSREDFERIHGKMILAGAKEKV